MRACHFLGYRDRVALRAPTYQPDWTEAECAAYDRGYHG